MHSRRGLAVGDLYVCHGWHLFRRQILTVNGQFFEILSALSFKKRPDAQLFSADIGRGLKNLSNEPGMSGFAFLSIEKSGFWCVTFFGKVTTYRGWNSMPDFEQPQVQMNDCEQDTVCTQATRYIRSTLAPWSHIAQQGFCTLWTIAFWTFWVTQTALFQHYIGSFILKSAALHMNVPCIESRHDSLSNARRMSGLALLSIEQCAFLGMLLVGKATTYTCRSRTSL